MSMLDATAERHVLTPSSLNRLVRDLLGDALPQVWIEGELSNVAKPASGHLYFTLKDRSAQVRCAMFKQSCGLLRFRPLDGMQVLLRARVGLYEPRGEFQLVAEYMEPAGEGALQRAFEELKARLGSEGIPVYEVRPGVIKTDMTSGVTEKYDKLIEGGLCVQPRWGYPEIAGFSMHAYFSPELFFHFRRRASIH